MIISFRHKGLREFFTTGSTAGICPSHAKRLRVILAQLNASEAVRDMNLPGLRLHSLRGSRAGYYAINVSGNWRLVFRFENKKVLDVDYCDYH